MRTSSTIWPSSLTWSVSLEAPVYVAKAKKAAVATWEPWAPSSRQRLMTRATSATSAKVTRSGPAERPRTACTATPAATAPTYRRDCTTDW